MWKIIGGVALVVGLLFGAYRIGTNAASGAAYSTGVKVGIAEGDKAGYLRGVEDNNKLRDKEIETLIAQTREAEEIARRKRNEEILAIEREQDERAQANRKAYIEKVQEISAIAANLSERLRRAESKARNQVRGANGGNAVPEATGAAGGSIDLATYTEWLLSEGGGKRVIRMAERAEEVNYKLELCRAK
jgi:hypothetical protein